MKVDYKVFLVTPIFVFSSCFLSNNGKVEKGKGLKSLDRGSPSKSISYGNPDTALCNFLYENADLPDWEDQKEEYIRLDIENEKVMSLFRNMYSQKSNYSILESQIEKNRKEFISYERSVVLNNYKEYNGISGMDFSFLLDRKDSLVTPILRDILINPNAPESEKEYAQKILNK